MTPGRPCDAGASRFNTTAASKISAAVRVGWDRTAGTSASNPPARHALSHRRTLGAETATRRPSGPRWSTSISERTSAPRSRADSSGSANGRISE